MKHNQKPLLADFSPQEEQAELKGYDEPVRFLRITAEELTAKRRPLPNPPPSPGRE